MLNLLLVLVLNLTGHAKFIASFSFELYCIY